MGLVFFVLYFIDCYIIILIGYIHKMYDCRQDIFADPYSIRSNPTVTLCVSPHPLDVDVKRTVKRVAVNSTIVKWYSYSMPIVVTLSTFSAEFME